MIRNFRDKETEKIARGDRSRKRPPEIQRLGAVLLARLDAAVLLSDVRASHGLDLKPRPDLGADYHSIRINDQWRVYFRWLDGDAYDVEIDDKH